MFRRFLTQVSVALLLATAVLTAASAQSVEEAGASDYALKAHDPTLDADALSIYLVPLTATDLAATADIWQGHVRHLLERLGDINLALRGADNATRKKLRSDYETIASDLLAATGKYQAVIAAWTLKGAAVEETQSHRDYIRAVTVSSLRATDVATLFHRAWNWLKSSDGGLRVLLGILAVIVAVWVLMFIARSARKIVGRTLDRAPSISHLLRTFITTVVYWVVFVVGLMVVLGLVGVNITPVFAVFGGLSFILGFALQETLGNLASGLMIMVLKPFDTGDYIEVSGSSGYVDEMSVVSTKIRTFDNQIIVVPNSKIWGDIITNVSASEERRVDLVFGIGYADDAAKAIDILQELVKHHPLCIEDPKTEVFVGELGESSVNIFCRPWCKSDDYWNIYWDLTGQAKIEFDKAGISIPFPQRDVHLIPVHDG